MVGKAVYVTKDTASVAKIFTEYYFDAPSGLLKIFSMPTP